MLGGKCPNRALSSRTVSAAAAPNWPRRRPVGWSECSGRGHIVVIAGRPRGKGSGTRISPTPTMQELTQMTVQDDATTKGVILTDAAAVKVSSLLPAGGPR